MSREMDVKLRDAAGGGDVGEMEWLIAAGANPNAFEGTSDWTALQQAARNGHLAAIAVLLKAGAHVDGVNSAGETPLMYAAVNGRTAVVRALIAAGADVQRSNTCGSTALSWAVAYGYLGILVALMEAGARSDVRNKDGKRPIDLVRDCR